MKKPMENMQFKKYILPNYLATLAKNKNKNKHYTIFYNKT